MTTLPWDGLSRVIGQADALTAGCGLRPTGPRTLLSSTLISSIIMASTGVTWKHTGPSMSGITGNGRHATANGGKMADIAMRQAATYTAMDIVTTDVTSSQLKNRRIRKRAASDR